MQKTLTLIMLMIFIKSIHNICPVNENCESCINEKYECTKCLSGYGLRISDKACIKCSENCDLTTNCDGEDPAKACIKCNYNYCLNNQKICVENLNCLEGCTITTPCTKCSLGYGLRTGDKKCIKCNLWCQNCDGDNPITSCNNCYNGYGLRTIDKTCRKCSINCNYNRNCNGNDPENECPECNEGYCLNPNKSCVSNQNCNQGCSKTTPCLVCNSGYGLRSSDSTCIQCIFDCENCDGNIP